MNTDNIIISTEMLAKKLGIPVERIKDNLHDKRKLHDYITFDGVLWRWYIDNRHFDTQEAAINYVDSVLQCGLTKAAIYIETLTKVFG